MSLEPRLDAVSIPRAELRALVIQLLLSPTTAVKICESIEKFLPLVGLTATAAYSIGYHEGKPELHEKQIIVDATTRQPINEAVILREETAGEIAAMLVKGASRYDFFGATYFTNKSSAEMIRLSLLRLN